ncbi:hypothetical protein BLS_007540 [Venturia inaequalis]|uniref:Ubiquitin ligase complex F-box protein GRR1 n=1 Tax=Venturia inaequalis TaxID=5025 RepID=A0A8H3ZAP0_VENIN|nr:hypothetical protein EG328_008381 [Venturia inaequalis]KAE9985481.1 hypothetical protein BLS_007540 [Venturia inaequalis]KAE9986874.1 hypothetical protein EG327_004098 [Venturia inaequalis]RDI82083.1 hypothetical protein Vi05172_g7976 [Venturia inaequalis]
MRISRDMSRRYSDGNRSSSSASTSPERDFDDDDNDYPMLHDNDSKSSLALSVPEELSDSAARDIAERQRLSPVSKLPAELMISIFQKLSSTRDLKHCMLVSRDWASNSVGLLWHRPQTGNWNAIQSVVLSLRSAHASFDYDRLVKRLNLATLANQVSDGSLQPFQNCNRIERLTLTGCTKLTDLSVVQMIKGNSSLLALDVTAVDGVTDKTMGAVAEYCYRLQGLNITACRQISDDSLVNVARCCRHLKRLKFNECKQLTDKTIIAFATNCPQLLEIDLHNCSQVEDEAVTALISEGPNLRELRLAHCTRITDNAFLNLPFETSFETLRILDLTDCGELQDAGVQKIISAAPRLRNLVLAKCRQITDRAVVAITKLGKNLHYIHLGHCARITDAGVIQLVKICTRIRYIDLACCTNLTDHSVTQLATLPKLKRIGLVKCNAITERSILALAKPKQSDPPALSSLERVHLSYCTNLTVPGIAALLNNCPRLTHLSLTGVQAFLHERLTAFCRSAPTEFNDHQREVFCVFSNEGVRRLRNYLNEQARIQARYERDGTMYDDSDIDVQGPPDNHNNAQTILPLAHAGYSTPVQSQTHQLHTLLPPPPPPALTHQTPFNQLPPLTIPPPQALSGEGSPNAMSPTNDAPLTLDDDDNFGDISELLIGNGNEMLLDPTN